MKVNRTGKNLIPMFSNSTQNGMVLTVDSDGTCHLTGTTSAPTTFTVAVSLPFSTPVFLSVNNPVIIANANVFCAIRNATNTNLMVSGFQSINDSTVVAINPINASWFVLYITTGITLSNFIFKPQIELGSTATPYEPYSGQEITLTAPQEIPAGWMDNEAAGRVTHGMVDLSTLNWSYDNAVGQERFFEYPAALPVKRPATSNDAAEIACSIYKTISANDVISHSADHTIGVTQDGYLVVYDATYTDSAAFKAAMSGVILCYKLATPVTITPVIAPLPALPQIDRITPRQNVLTASTDNVELTYAKSPIREADELAAAIAALS